MPGHRIPNDKKVVVKSLVDAGMPYRRIQEITSISLASITNTWREYTGISAKGYVHRLVKHSKETL